METALGIFCLLAFACGIANAANSETLKSAVVWILLATALGYAAITTLGGGM